MSRRTASEAGLPPDMGAEGLPGRLGGRRAFCGCVAGVVVGNGPPRGEGERGLDIHFRRGVRTCADIQEPENGGGDGRMGPDKTGGGDIGHARENRNGKRGTT